MTSRTRQFDRDLGVRSRVLIGAYVRELRRDMNLTGTAFSALIGLGPDVLSKIENACMNMPTSRAADFAHHLAVDPQEFALMILSLHEPHLFSLVFPSATMEPLSVPDEDFQRVEAIINRRTSWKRLKTAMAKGSSRNPRDDR